MSKIIVIGAGLGGMSAATLLAKEGHDVLILEKNNLPGGKLGFFEKDGFRFDTGPSWYMMHEIFENYFSQLGKNYSDYYKLQKIDPLYKIFFSDGTEFHVPIDPEETIKLFESIEKGAGDSLRKLLSDAKEKYDMGLEYMYKNFSSVFDLIDLKLIISGIKLRAYKNLETESKKYFKSEKLRQLTTWHSVFLGNSPANLPSLYSLMAHVDFNLGNFYPEGGMFSVSKGFEKLATDFGVEINYNSPVEKIVVENGESKGVISNGEFFEADIVVSNADYYFTETKLLEKEYQTYSKKYWKKKVFSPGTFLIYLGINKKLENVEHHNYYFSGNWKGHFDSIYKTKSWPKEDPSYYVCAASKTDPNCAPEGNENLFFLVPIANGLEDSVKIREKFFEKTVSHFEKMIGESVAENIVFKKTSAIKAQENIYNSYKGNSFGLAHTLFQTASFRPKNKSGKVNNLYYTGSGTIPGVGLPSVVISGEVTAKRILKEINN